MKLRPGNVFTLVYDSAGGLFSSMYHRSHDQGVSDQEVSVWESLSRGLSIQGGLCPGGLCPGRRVSVQGVSVKGVSVQGSLSRGSLSRGLCPGGYLSREVSVWGISVQGGFRRQRPPRTVMSGRYASYRNAFLFEMY